MAPMQFSLMASTPHFPLGPKPSKDRHRKHFLVFPGGGGKRQLPGLFGYSHIHGHSSLHPHTAGSSRRGSHPSWPAVPVACPRCSLRIWHDRAQGRPQSKACRAQCGNLAAEHRPQPLSTVRPQGSLPQPPREAVQECWGRGRWGISSPQRRHM